MNKKEHYNDDKFCIISQDAFKQLIQNEYNHYPELVPFSDGDRASLLNQESAEAFAKRRWREYYTFPRRKYGPDIGPGNSQQPRSHAAYGRTRQSGSTEGGTKFKVGTMQQRTSDVQRGIDPTKLDTRNNQ